MNGRISSVHFRTMCVLVLITSKGTPLTGGGYHTQRSCGVRWCIRARRKGPPRIPYTEGFVVHLTTFDGQRDTCCASCGWCACAMAPRDPARFIEPRGPQDSWNQGATSSEGGFVGDALNQQASLNHKIRNAYRACVRTSGGRKGTNKGTRACVWAGRAWFEHGASMSFKTKDQIP
jgi:hypothetical protein